MKSQLTRTLVAAILTLTTIPAPTQPDGGSCLRYRRGVGTSSPERITYRATWITRLISEARIRLQWTSRAPDANAVDTLPGVFTAVEEQLGLKLESSTRSYPELIIDLIEREPTQN